MCRISAKCNNAFLLKESKNFVGGRMLNRLKWYNQVKNHRLPLPIDWKKEEANKAELKVLEMVRNNNLTICTFHQKRIPDVNKIKGFGEIDVIAITKKAVFAIEVKNWTGEIDIVNGNLIQTNRKPNSRNVFDHISTKADNIKFVYLSEFGEELFEVKPLIVMTNKNCKFSKSVEEHPMIVKLPELTNKITKTVEKLEDYDSKTTDKLIQIIEKFPTWDTVILENTREEIGDLTEDSIPLDWKRENYASIDVSIPRGLISTLLFGPQIKISKITHDNSIEEEIIKPANYNIKLRRPTIDSKFIEFPITKIKSINYGYYGVFDWQSFSANNKQNQNQKVENDFKVGGIYHGRIADDLDYAYLIVLREKKVTGLLFKDSLNVHVDFLDSFYSLGQTVKVKIKKFSNKKRSKCILKEVND